MRIPVLKELLESRFCLDRCNTSRRVVHDHDIGHQICGVYCNPVLLLVTGNELIEIRFEYHPICFCRFLLLNDRFENRSHIPSCRELRQKREGVRVNLIALRKHSRNSQSHLGCRHCQRTPTIGLAKRSTKLLAVSTTSESRNSSLASQYIRVLGSVPDGLNITHDLSLKTTRRPSRDLFSTILNFEKYSSTCSPILPISTETGRLTCLYSHSNSPSIIFRKSGLFPMASTIRV